MAKKKTRKDKRRLIMISLIMMALLVSLIGTLYKNFKSVIQNKKASVALTLEYEKLLDEQDKLESEVKKMQDPAYIARYAKEKYLYSTEGEYIIRID